MCGGLRDISSFSWSFRQRRAIWPGRHHEDSRAGFLQIVTQVALQDIGQLADACPESSWMRVDLLVPLNGHPSPVHVLLQGNLQANLHANSFVAFRIARRVFALGADMDSGTERRRVPCC
jgi:hypothetical protein